MRVLHVNDYPLDHPAAGGAERLAVRAVELQRERGHNVRLFTSSNLRDDRRTPARYIDNRHARECLRRELYAFSPDVIHLHNIYHLLSPGVLSTIRRYRGVHPCVVVMTAHDAHLVCPNAALCTAEQGQLSGVRLGTPPRVPSIWRGPWDQRGTGHSWMKRAQHVWNYRICARQRVIDEVITPSRFLAGLLEQRGLKTAIVRNPIPMDRPRSAGRPTDALHIVYAGRLAPEKGVRGFLRQLPAHLPLRVHIIGDGPDDEACRTCVQRRTLIDRVTFHGRLSHEETLARIAAGHVLIMPGRCHENAPLVVFEALAQGTNVLLADRGGLPEIVNDLGVGMLYEPDDATALATALTALVRAHEAATLNAFDVSALLGSHMEWAWCDAMLKVYERLRHRQESIGTRHPEHA